MNYYFGVFRAKKKFYSCMRLFDAQWVFLSRPLISFHFLPALSFVRTFFLFCTSIYFCEPTSVCLWVCDTRFVLVPLLWCVQSDNNSFGSVHTSSSCYTYEIYLIIIDAELQSSLNRLIFRLVFISPSYFTLSALKIHPSQSIIFNALHGSIGGLSCSLFFSFYHIFDDSFHFLPWLSTASMNNIQTWKEFFVLKIRLWLDNLKCTLYCNEWTVRAKNARFILEAERKKRYCGTQNVFKLCVQVRRASISGKSIWSGFLYLWISLD